MKDAPNAEGIRRISRSFVEELAKQAPKDWDLDSLLIHIGSESGFNPCAQNGSSGAAGLIQLTEASAKRFAGTGVAGVARMSALEQLPAILRYFAIGKPLKGADFKLLGFSRNPSLIGAPRERVIYPAGSAAAKGHKAFQDAAGAITVGSVRDWWESYTRTRAAGRVSLDELGTKKAPACASGSSGGWFAVTLGGAAAILVARKLWR